MVASSQLAPGMIVSLNNKLFKVETSVKVTIPKGSPFIKSKLRDLESQQLIEKNFKTDQQLKEVALAERRLEFLYLEGKDYLFLDIGSLDQVLVPHQIIANRANYLKEGVEIKASMYGNVIFAVELPQFLELMINKIEAGQAAAGGETNVAILETGARVEVPPFVEVGDIIKVDTKTDEYIQRM
jgi:elongation factor P